MMNEPLLIDLRLPPLTLTQRPLLAAGLFSPSWIFTSLILEPVGFLLSLLGSASNFL